MGRMENVEIFEDTQYLCRTISVLREAITYSQKHQVLIREKDMITDHSGEEQYDKAAKIIISKKRSFEAAKEYPGKKVCILNFASATNPGGGVVRGASAQEECLCRCSTLYPNLDCRDMWNGFYTPHRRSGDPLHNDDCIYTPNVLVIKTDTNLPCRMPESEWYSVNVLTCAAPNLREKPGNRMNPADGSRKIHISNQDLQKLHEQRARRIFNIAAEYKNEVLILGAFGCGAFQNPPSVVANAMKTVTQQFRRCFDTIEFAVYCPPHREENYQSFRAVLTR